ncbi:MAG: hypothetical protein ACFFBD_12430 [Candidatus Hodarchaeota archaeon]
MAAFWSKLLGIQNLSSESKSLTSRYIILDLIRIFSFNMVSMFIVLYFLDTLTLLELGIIFAVGYIITALVDYPTGALGDAIGHKSVLVLAYAFHLVSTVLLLFSDTFFPLLIYNSLSAFASSQESGALESWFDNGYRSLSERLDPERSIYKAFQARRSVFVTISSGASFITGGLIAQFLSRKMLFATFLLLIFVAFFLIITLMTRTKSKDSKITLSLYLQQLSGGFRFFISQKGIFLFFVGTTIIWAANLSIWYNFLLFPTYANYSGGTDALTGLFRTLVFLSGAVWQLVIVKFISKVKRVKLWIFITTTLSNPVFFSIVYLYYLFVPPTHFDLVMFLSLFLIFQIPSIWESLEFTLRSRLNLDLVPDEFRNSVYSLLPTLTTLIGIPGAAVGGFFIQTFGFTSGIFLTAALSGLGALAVGLGVFFLPSLPIATQTISKKEVLSSTVSP